MSTKKLIQTYRELLATADLEITDDDCVSLRVPQESGKVKLVPLTLKGKRLVLPTKAHLALPDWDSRVCFHPLSENTAAGESEVLEKFRACLNHRFNTVIPIIMMGLLRIGASLDDQKKLDPEQAEFLPAVKNLDIDKTGKSPLVESFKAILSKMPANTPTKQFINIGLRRKFKLENIEYFRGGSVHFPFYEELLKREGTVHGVKLRKKDYDVLIGLMDYILPHQGEANYYSRGSDSRTGPSTDAVMKAVLAVAGPINDVISRFGKLLPDDLEIPCDWAPTFDNIGTLINEIRDIPMLQGNEGTTDDDRKSAQTPVIAQVQAQAQEPARAPIPGTQQAPAAGYRAPIPGVQGQRPPHDNKSTDIDSLLRNNPALAQQAGYRAQGWGGYQQPQPTRATAGNPVTPVGGGWQRGGGGGWGRGGGGQGGGFGGGGWRPSI